MVISMIHSSESLDSLNCIMSAMPVRSVRPRGGRKIISIIFYSHTARLFIFHDSKKYCIKDKRKNLFHLATSL